MAEQVASAAGSSGSTQVFVDDSGRRRRWVRLAGGGVTVLCAAYMGIVVVGLSQTAVGPLITVPSDGNGRVAGFPDSSGVVPGLLATGGIGVARPVHRAAAPAPVIRPRDVGTVAAARPANAAGAKGAARVAPTPTPAATPTRGSGSAANSGRGRTEATSGTAASAVTA